MMSPIPLQSWIHQFVRQVLGSKTKFSLRTKGASRDGREDSVATALFPIPLPHEDAFWDGPGLSSQKRRRSRALKKLMHLIIMTLNYEHFRNPMSILKLIRRRHAARHRAVYARIRMFIEACGPSTTVSMVGCEKVFN